MTPRIVIVRHALRNALLPAIQGAGLVLGWLLGQRRHRRELSSSTRGSVSALTDAVHNRDLPVIQAIVLLFAAGDRRVQPDRRPADRLPDAEAANGGSP